MFRGTNKFKVLVLGASYGSLLGTKLSLAGHAVTLVCTTATAELINREGTFVRLPIRDRQTPVMISSRANGLDILASTPDAVDPRHFDLVVFAMQEPHYGSEGVKQLMRRIAVAQVPCLAIMNMPPLPFLKRIAGIATKDLSLCYVDPGVWDGIAPGLVTLASPDPQAYRPPEEDRNVLQVGLPTNFKVASFESAEHTAMLAQLQDDIEAIRYDAGDGEIELPVKLKVHDSHFVPLAKWLMLLTGNYRCIQSDKMISIKEAVYTDIDASRAIYDWVGNLCKLLGATDKDLVPFDKYAAAAKGLLKPSSVARALFGGANQIERVDLLVQRIAFQQGLRHSVVDEMVMQVNRRLQINRETRLFEKVD